MDSAEELARRFVGDLNSLHPGVCTYIERLLTTYDGMSPEARETMRVLLRDRARGSIVELVVA